MPTKIIEAVVRRPQLAHPCSPGQTNPRRPGITRVSGKRRLSCMMEIARCEALMQGTLILAIAAAAMIGRLLG